MPHTITPAYVDELDGFETLFPDLSGWWSRKVTTSEGVYDTQITKFAADGGIHWNVTLRPADANEHGPGEIIAKGNAPTTAHAEQSAETWIDLHRAALHFQRQES